MSVEECKRVLPLPQLLVKLGYGEANRAGFIPSPFRPGESGDSFHIFEKAGQWFYKDHATGDKGGDEVKFLEAVRALDVRSAIELYHELAGVAWQKQPKPVSERPAAPRGQGDSLGKPTHIYVYENADGSHAFEVLRYLKDDGGKTFRQRRHARGGERSSNGWVWRVNESDRVLYHLPEVMAAPADEPVFVVEGEKDADNLRKLKLVATCNAGGAGKWQPNYTTSLTGKHVLLISDNDLPGREHAQTIAELVRPVASSVGVIDIRKLFPGCPEKSDVSDWIKYETNHFK